MIANKPASNWMIGVLVAAFLLFFLGIITNFTF